MKSQKAAIAAAIVLSCLVGVLIYAAYRAASIPAGSKPPSAIDQPDRPRPAFQSTTPPGALPPSSTSTSTSTTGAPAALAPERIAAAMASVRATPNPPVADLEPDFAGFLDWAIRRIESGPADAASLARLQTEGIELARRRRDDLVDLIQGNPQRALELAIPETLRALLPSSVTDLLETPVSGRGDLEVVCALPEPGSEIAVKPLQRFALLDGERYEAFVYGRRLGEGTLRGASLHGIVLDGAMAVDESPVRPLSESMARQVLAAEPARPCALGRDHPAAQGEAPGLVAVEAFGNAELLCSADHASAYAAQLAALGGGTVSSSGTVLPASAATEGTKRLLFIRVDFPDLIGEPFSSNRAVQLTRELDKFYRENSYDRAGFVGIDAGSAVTPVFRMPKNASTYGGANNADGLRADARNAARNAGYNLSAYDYDLTCMGSVPGFGWAGLGFVGAPGAWIRATSSTGVAAHELGHNFGLNHANFWDTGGETTTGAGQSIEYGDKFDTMGAANAGNYHFNARYKRLLGWLKEGEFTVATTNGTYRIHAHDQTNSVDGSRGLQVFANARTNYWVEFRQRFSSIPWLMNGAGLRWAGRGGESSQLLDTTPGTTREKDDGAIVIGRTYSDVAAGIHLTPIGKGGADPAWLDVVVQRGTFSNNHRPDLALVAPVLTGGTTTTFEFEAQASDPDGDPLAFAWEFGDESVGANAASVSHRWTTAGEYVVQCTASDMRGGVARRFVVVRVGSPTTVRLSGTVTADGEPVVGARVTAGSGRQTFTDSDGAFVLAGINRGSVNLSASLGGTRLAPVNFSSPLNVTTTRTDLRFAAADGGNVTSVTLLAAGSSWKYWDQGTAPEAAWRDADFDDSAWNAGAAILGYGGDRETTVIGYGPDSSRKYITAWFRRQFVVDDPSRLSNVRLGILRDDGAVVYLNGHELFRENMNSGAVTAQTLAASTVSGAGELTYFEHDLDPASLVKGTNLLAIEVHQSAVTSSDTALDVRIFADLNQAQEPGVHLTRPVEGDSFNGPARIVFSAIVGEITAAPVDHVEFVADGQVIGAATNPPLAMVWNNAPAGDHVVLARAVLNDGTTVESPAATILVQDASVNPTLIARRSAWRYLDTGVAPAADWNTTDFDDRGWAEGPARLGYGEDGEFTVISYGSAASQKHITTWFRRSFDVADVGAYTNLTCRLQKDDGAVVYLNGREQFRFGIRAGAVTPALLAQSDIQNEAEQTWTERALDPAALQEGRNVVAVEVHQSNATSSDLGFDLELLAKRATALAVPALSWKLTEAGILLSWPARLAGWLLESSPGLGPEAAWSPVAGTPTQAGDQLELTVSAAQSQRFHRLKSP